MLVFFIPKKSEVWHCEEAVTVSLVAGAKPEQDLLFIKAFESASSRPSRIGSEIVDESATQSNAAPMTRSWRGVNNCSI